MKIEPGACITTDDGIRCCRGEDNDYKAYYGLADLHLSTTVEGCDSDSAIKEFEFQLEKLREKIRVMSKPKEKTEQYVQFVLHGPHGSRPAYMSMEKDRYTRLVADPIARFRKMMSEKPEKSED